MIEPVRDFVLVEKEEDLKKSPGGIVMVSGAEERIITGKVLAVGAGQISAGQVMPLTVKVGDVVIFNKSLAVDYKHDNKAVFFLREENVMGIQR
jgi:chaperonin GroES